MKSNKLYTAVLILLIIFSCNHKEDKSVKLEGLVHQIPDSDAGIANEKEFFRDTAGKQSQQSPAKEVPVKQDWDKKIIKNAALNLEVKDYKTYYSFIRQQVNEIGGYVAQEELSQSEYKIENTLIIKVPVDQFDNAVTALSDKVEKVNEKRISSQDVTAEILDTRSRMEAKKQVRLRYLDLLKQAKNMEEILNVQSQINGIQEEIEAATGRISYLGHSSSFSTISLTYYQVLNSTARNNDKPSLGNQLLVSFKAGWTWVGNLLLALTTIWPLLLVLLGAFVLYKKIKKGKPVVD